MEAIKQSKHRTLLFMSLATQKTLENSIHSSILEMLERHFEKVIVFCRGKKYSVQKGNIHYWSGSFVNWWSYQKEIPKHTLIYINDFFIGGLFGVLLKKRKRSQLFLRAASPWVYELNSVSAILKTMLLKITKPIVIKNSDKVIYNSKSLVQHQYKHNYEVVYNGVDTHLFRPMNVPRISPKLNLIFIGNLNPEKGLTYLFRAVEPIQDKVHLSIVGDGRLLQKYKKDYPFAKYYGRIEHHQLPEIINQHDVLVLPTFVESFPNVLLEAMACGKPVIASKVFGVPEMVVKGRNGLLVPPQNTAAIKESLLYLLRHPHNRIKMGENGRKIAEDNFKTERQIQKVYNAILSRLK